jgi:hypothetical protein
MKSGPEDGAIAIVKAEAVEEEGEGGVKLSGIFKLVGSGK